jgi:DNA-binding transcriptional ArsR family regulator
MTGSMHELTDVDRLIHEPARLMIVSILSAVDQADFLYLLHETGLTRGNLSAHLSKLEEAGYIHIIKTFRGKVPQTLCNLTNKGQTAFEVYRKQLKSIVEKIS